MEIRVWHQSHWFVKHGNLNITCPSWKVKTVCSYVFWEIICTCNRIPNLLTVNTNPISTLTHYKSFALNAFRVNLCNIYYQIWLVHNIRDFKSLQYWRNIFLLGPLRLLYNCFLFGLNLHVSFDIFWRWPSVYNWFLWQGTRVSFLGSKISQIYKFLFFHYFRQCMHPNLTLTVRFLPPDNEVARR